MSRPRIVLSASRHPGRYKRHADMSGPGGADVPLGDVPAGRMVRVQVGPGLLPEDLPQTLAFARQVRHVARVEIHGETPRAVEAARKVLTAAWDLIDEQEAPGGAAGAAAGQWAALWLAMRPKAGGGR
ncbi:MAG: hypothetical protein JWO98_4869 [Frankiales bacterium]|nr:hypothetical protein [Frankiales bacterium]